MPSALVEVLESTDQCLATTMEYPELAFACFGQTSLEKRGWICQNLLSLVLVRPVLPSRSALSDLGLISDLFENMLPNWSSFCLKSPLFSLENPRSLTFTVSAFDTKRKTTCKFP